MHYLIRVAIITGLLMQIAMVQTATKTKFVNAFTTAGILNPNFITAQEYTGKCLMHSAVNPGRPDAWQCQANTLKLDPCFEDGSNVACLTSPWENKIAVLEVTTPLNRATVRQVDTTKPPWGVELTNGQRCVFVPNPKTMIYKQYVTYQCSSYRFSGLGLIDRSSHNWKIAVYDTHLNNIETMNITTAYF